MVKSTQQMRRHPLVFPGCSLQGAKSRDKRSHDRFRFHPRKRCANTEMNAEAERVVVVSLTIKPELGRSIVVSRIAVCCRHDYVHIFSDRYILTVIMHRPQRPAHQKLNRRIETQCLFDTRFNERRISHELRV